LWDRYEGVNVDEEGKFEQVIFGLSFEEPKWRGIKMF
jgi:hypothetical protein